MFFSTGIQNGVVTSDISIEFLVYLNRERKAKANKAICSLQIRNRSEGGTQLYRSILAGEEKQEDNEVNSVMAVESSFVPVHPYNQSGSLYMFLEAL